MKTWPAMTMILLRPQKKTSPDRNSEDFRVLTNLARTNPVYAAKFLTNKTESDARSLLSLLDNDEVTSLYNLMVA